ncbi:hypothetical protein [Photobacterium leiognathi]|uniref:hypothetical protein n=1 Tax=Photobacterium leiognathi TaxID=553611 RepID=UPI002980A4A0|nr:hypothetical protein [Photobacterium leiognathi]
MCTEQSKMFLAVFQLDDDLLTEIVIGVDYDEATKHLIQRLIDTLKINEDEVDEFCVDTLIDLGEVLNEATEVYGEKEIAYGLLQLARSL